MCSCQKGNQELTRQVQVTQQRAAISNDQWGPILWKFLHIAAEKSYSPKDFIDDVIVGNLWNSIIQKLPNVLPCPDCQSHARRYLDDHPFNATDKRGKDLQTYVREYLFAFHTDVRSRKGQPVLVSTIEDCQQLYESQEYTQFNTDTLMTYFRIATKYQVVQTMTFNRWKMNYDRLIKMTKMI
jgi:hypothetical protein